MSGILRDTWVSRHHAFVMIRRARSGMRTDVAARRCARRRSPPSIERIACFVVAAESHHLCDAESPTAAAW
jgi:hypothetical protein